MKNHWDVPCEFLSLNVQVFLDALLELGLRLATRRAGSVLDWSSQGCGDEGNEYEGLHLD